MEKISPRFVLFQRIVATTLFVAAVGSLFFPYLHRLNVHSGPPVAPTEPGLRYTSAVISLILMGTATFLLFGKNRLSVISATFVAILGCGSLLFVRRTIHFQGFIDHDFDTKAGIGFYILSCCASALAALSISAITWTPAMPESKGNELLLDDGISEKTP